MPQRKLLSRLACTLLTLSCFTHVSIATACTVSESMENSQPLNSTEIENSDRVRIVEMMLAARQWPDVQVRGIVYAGGYIKERDPKALADERAASLKAYLIQLGVKDEYIWIDKRVIKSPDVDDKGHAELHQIGVTLVPICEGGCDRLCTDPRVTPNSRVIQ